MKFSHSTVRIILYTRESIARMYIGYYVSSLNKLVLCDRALYAVPYQLCLYKISLVSLNIFYEHDLNLRNL